MKNAELGGEARRGTIDKIGAVSFVPSYRIASLTPCAFGSKIAEGRVEIDSVGWIDIEVYAPHGREPFVATGSTREKYSGGYVRRCGLVPELLEAIRGSVLQRLAVESGEEP